MKKNIRCLALFSGGLDSMIAIRLMKMQNIDVLALHMNTGFGGKGDSFEKIKKYANMAGADFEVVDIKNKYLQDVLFTPEHGYGKYLNPCIDCHGYMFKTALNMLEDKDAKFIVTGEVVGQRPMSQRTAAMNSVKKLAEGNQELILRPLSAKLLKETLPEINGWVDRNKLYDISGRSRKTQLALAKEFGFEEFQSPAGGCLLTLENFYIKMKDMIKHEKLETDKDTDVLKFGRHMRLPDGTKLIIGRNEEDNLMLSKINNEKFDEITLIDAVGGFCLISKNPTKEDLELAFKTVLAYAKTESNKDYKLKYKGDIYTAQPLESKEEVSKYLIV